MYVMKHVSSEAITIGRMIPSGTNSLPADVLKGGIVLNATSNTISVILWQSVLLVEETGVPRENHRPVASH
jgi:hypothetical protein